MRILNRYIWSSVLLPSIGVVFTIVALESLFSFLAELENLRRDYHALQAMQYIATTMPRRIYDFLPLAILLGALTGLGMLANSGELTVIRAAGVSVARVSRMALRPAILLLVVGLLLGEFVVPYTEQVAERNKNEQLGRSTTINLREGYWHREGDEFIHINGVGEEGTLYGVTRYEFTETRELKNALFIEEAQHQGDYWEIKGLHGSRLEANQVVTFTEESGRWETGLSPDLLKVVSMKPEHLALSKLWEYITYLQEQQLEVGEYKLTFWQKILQPFAIIGMVLIAISFIFGPLRETPMSLRLTTGAIAGLLFHYGQQFIGHISLVFHLSPFIAAASPPLLCCVLGVWLLSRIR